MDSQLANDVPQEAPNFFKEEGQAAQAPEAGEQKSPEAIAKSEEQERLAAKFAEAARRNSALRAKQREIKAPLQEKDSKIQQLEAELARLKKYEEVEDPMELLNLRGIKYEDLIARNLNPESFDQKTEFKKVMDEVAALKKELADRDESAKKREEEAAHQSVEEGKKQYLDHLRSFTEKNLDKYELIHAFEAHEDVFDVIAETMRKTGKLISDDEAAELVEKVLEENYLDRFAKINKLKSKITPSTEGQQKVDLFKQQATLTNQLTPQTSARKERISDEEAMKRAAALIKWENN
jgi:hypothetical protein